MNAELDDAIKIRMERLESSTDLEQSLHEMTIDEMLYCMAKIIEEMTWREKNK